MISCSSRDISDKTLFSLFLRALAPYQFRTGGKPSTSGKQPPEEKPKKTTSAFSFKCLLAPQ
jgi:hypothetical protein